MTRLLRVQSWWLKFRKSENHARNISAGLFTGEIATVVHQARIHHSSVQKESRRDTSHDGERKTNRGLNLKTGAADDRVRLRPSRVQVP